MNGPYFEGQRVQACGHYFPDVLRFKDVKRGRVYIRILDCVHCGQYEEELVNITSGLMLKLDRYGEAIGVCESDMVRVRESHLKRILEQP